MKAEGILSSEMLIVVAVFLLAVAWFSLAVSMIEEFITRDHKVQNQEAAGAISMMRRICVPTMLFLSFFTATFVVRAMSGFPSIRDGMVFATMINYIVVFIWGSLPGATLWFMVLKHRDISEFESERNASERERLSRLEGDKNDD